jgi:alkylhydroperoxidase/carboxymuconolactone decarboxylase family protein YurZ
MTEQIKELIALGAAVGADGEPRVKHHYDKASKLGLSTQLMREAIQIGEAVKAASARNIANLVGPMFAAAAQKAVARSCCGGSAKAKQPASKAARCC